jgi:succinate dehydrogenase/fumarate reductase-like Fe-S protein
VARLRKRLLAYLLLAWRLVLHLLAAPFRRTGLPRFRTNYEADGIFHLTPQDRALYHAFSRCIGCGLCDVFCEGLRGAPRVLPSALAIAESRSLPDLSASLAGAENFLGCPTCGACERACPTAVPLRSLAAFVAAHGKALAPRKTGK